MNNSDLHLLKFPIGEFIKPDSIDASHMEQWIKEIQLFPSCLKNLVEELSAAQLQWKYRPEGWMIKQVVHHCADSHMNSLMRFKLTLTEELPDIKPYWEDRWAELVDSHDDDLTYSLMFIEGLHYRWVKLLQSLTPADLKKEFVHPEHGKHFSLEENIGVYAWHSNHHLAHIRQAIESNGKY
ncbi:MAG: putative metal-dependent hydrolase [Reichenbachiella sp.]